MTDGSLSQVQCAAMLKSFYGTDRQRHCDIGSFSILLIINAFILYSQSLNSEKLNLKYFRFRAATGSPGATITEAAGRQSVPKRNR